MNKKLSACDRSCPSRRGLGVSCPLHPANAFDVRVNTGDRIRVRAKAQHQSRGLPSRRSVAAVR